MQKKKFSGYEFVPSGYEFVPNGYEFVTGYEFVDVKLSLTAHYYPRFSSDFTRPEGCRLEWRGPLKNMTLSATRRNFIIDVNRYSKTIIIFIFIIAFTSRPSSQTGIKIIYS